VPTKEENESLEK